MEQTKAEVRARALALRDEIPAQERMRRSEKIVENLTDHACYQEAQALLIYVSFRSEVDTVSLIERAFSDGKAVFVPRVAGRDMDFFRIKALSDLEEGYYGILEPREHITEVYDPLVGKAVMCMPGVAFDRAHHRIGYGGGYYDRYLSGLSKRAKAMICTAALAYDCQILQEIPWDNHDIRPSRIFTETEILIL